MSTISMCGVEGRLCHRVFTGYWETRFFGPPDCFFAYRLPTGFVHDDFKLTGYLPGLFVRDVF
jgi:hypothetical protein